MKIRDTEKFENTKFLKQVPGYFRTGKSGLLLTTSLVACGMLWFRVVLTGNFYYFFLPWNLMLAWLPYLISLSFRKLPGFGQRPGRAILLFLAWLLFLPNSPYLVTDLVHLTARAGIPLWYDALLIVLFAWTGLLLGLMSIYNVHRFLRINFRTWLSGVILTVTVLLCSFGIYVGRILRWNSWDLIVRPIALGKSIAAQFLHPFQHQQSFGMTLSFFVFLMVSYYALLVLSNPHDYEAEI